MRVGRANLAGEAAFVTVSDVIRHWSKVQPSASAVTWRDNAISYGELNQRSNGLAARLLTAGCGPDAPVGFLGGNSALVFEAWFAAAKAGAPFVAFNWRCSVAELTEIIKDATPSVVFVDRAHLEAAEAVERACGSLFQMVEFDPEDHRDAIDAWTSGLSHVDPGGPSSSDAVTLLVYTSGTTGTPKGVAMSHAAMVAGFYSCEQVPAMAWKQSDKVVMAMPNFHLGGSFLSMQALMTGAVIDVLPAFESAALLQRIAERRATILPLVPTALQMMLDDERRTQVDVTSLRKIVYFGSPIGADAVRRASQAFGCELTQYYGATEAWILTMLDNEGHDLNNPARLASAGLPAPGVELRITHPNGREASVGEIGEVTVRSPTMFSGYWRKPAETNAAWVDGWYHTGDLGRREADGYLYLLDRTKDMIISGGENVYSAEVERALLKHHAVAAAAVVGAPDPRWGEKVVAFVAPHPNATLEETELKAHCRTLLAGYKVPKLIVIEAALPLTASGKVHKPTLRARCNAHEPATASSSSAPALGVVS